MQLESQSSNVNHPIRSKHKSSIDHDNLLKQLQEENLSQKKLIEELQNLVMHRDNEIADIKKMIKNKTVNLQFKNSKVPAIAESFDPAINANNINHLNQMKNAVAIRNPKMRNWLENKNQSTNST